MLLSSKFVRDKNVQAQFVFPGEGFRNHLPAGPDK
jgi:hypothetical protein